MSPDSTPDNSVATFDASRTTRTVNHVGASALWSKGLSGEGVVVAVLDSGVNFAHPDLRGSRWGGNAHGGWNVRNDTSDISDSTGHGTAVAGVIAGNGASGTITGCAPRATILAIRTEAYSNYLRDGLEWAIDHGAHLVNISWTHRLAAESEERLAWRRLCERALERGVAVFVSAGERGYTIPRAIGTPGDCPPPWLHPLQLERTPEGGRTSAITCGATSAFQSPQSTASDRVREGSPSGPVAWRDYPYDEGRAALGLIKPDLCAPGDVYTCRHGYEERPYEVFSGTSAATAVASGCAALLVHASLRSGGPIRPARIQEALEKTCVKIEGQVAAKQNGFGSGRIDVAAAYAYGADSARMWWS